MLINCSPKQLPLIPLFTILWVDIDNLEHTKIKGMCLPILGDFTNEVFLVTSSLQFNQNDM